MANQDPQDPAEKFKDLKSLIQKLQDELKNTGIITEKSINTFSSEFGSAIQVLVTDLNSFIPTAELLGDQVAGVAKKFSNDIARAVKKIENDNAELTRLQVKLAEGEDLTYKEQQRLTTLQERQDRAVIAIDQAIIGLLREGIDLDEEVLAGITEQLIIRQQILDIIEQSNQQQIENQGLAKSLLQTIKNIALKFDETGLAAKLFSNNLQKSQRAGLEVLAGIGFLITATLQASNNISNIAKNTGLSADEAKRLQINFAVASLESNKIFITSQRLNEAFVELTRQSGLIADFGGDILVTQATLTKQLGLSAEQAGNLSLLSRIQSKDTEEILENTISTVGAISSQNRVALDAKGILAEIASTSAAIAVSLGMNPIEIAEAVAQAKLLGLSLAEVDAIASSLLDFESSITAELEAEVLLGRDLNLEKARLLALNNDLAGLGEEIRNQEEIRLAFATGNRIQQEAAAKAIGISRDQLAKITLQQEINRLGAEQFKDTYGEVTFQQLQSQSASEKFADTLEKIKGIIGDVGIALAPVLDIIASIASNTTLISAIIGGALAASIVRVALQAAVLLSQFKAIAVASSITAAFSNPALLISGIIGAGIAAGFVSSLIANAKKADDFISPGYGERMILSPEGTIALNNEDTIVAGTDLMGENNLTNNVIPTTNNISSITPITNNTSISNPINNIAGNTTPISNTVISSNSSLRNQTSSTVVTTPNDNSSLIRELRENNKYLKQIAEREGTVKIDSTRAGTAFSMGTYQVQ